MTKSVDSAGQLLIMKPDFVQIREAVKAIVAAHGGKLEINEWNGTDDETLKIVMTFKKPYPISMSQTNLRTAAALR